MSGPEYTPPSLAELSPVSSALELLARYGWWVLGAAAVLLWSASKLHPHYRRWQQAREDAAYHKDPDMTLKRMEAIQRARELQQERLAAESARALERQHEREEKRRAEVAALLAGAGGSGAGGSRLGSATDYLPLSGGAAAGSNYRPPKKSKCGGGGCGR